MLFKEICDDLETQSYSVQHEALPSTLIDLLYDRVNSPVAPLYKTAGIGRSIDHHVNQDIRCDEIAWIRDDTPAGHEMADKEWIEWTEALRAALNRQLFLTLSPIESHYARYPKGGFYKQHIDAFSGINNRKISIVLFLNSFWKSADKGELQLFVGVNNLKKVIVKPKIGTLVVFLSDEIPHEVLTTSCIRNSIAGWYR